MRRHLRSGAMVVCAGRAARLVPPGRRPRPGGGGREQGPAAAVRKNADMRPRSAAFGLWAALTFSCAVLVHGVIHAVGGPGVRVGLPGSPRHARRRPWDAGRRRRPAGPSRPGPRTPPPARLWCGPAWGRRRWRPPRSACSSRARSPSSCSRPKAPRSSPSGSRRRPSAGCSPALLGIRVPRHPRPGRRAARRLRRRRRPSHGAPDHPPPGAPPGARDRSLPAVRPEPSPAARRLTSARRALSAARSSPQ